jgi:CheY-like chemotaxis protein
LIPVKRILVVDGDRAAADTLQGELDRLGLTTDVAYDDIGAIRRAQESRPDVVVASLGPAGGNGLELCVGIRTTPALRGVPLLLLAKEADDGLEERALKLRIADAFVRLPITTQDLVQRIGKLVQLDPPTTRPHPAFDATTGAVTTLVDEDVAEVSSGHIEVAPTVINAPAPAPPRPPPRSSTTMPRVGFPEDRAAEALAAVHAAMGAPEGPRRPNTVRSMPAVSLPRPADSPASGRGTINERPPARTREVTDLREQVTRSEQQVRTLQKEVAGLQSDRDLAAKRAADSKTRLQRLEAQRDEAREALANLERTIRTTNDKHEEDLRKQRESFAESLAAAEAAQREASRAADEARREMAKMQASLQAEERARQAKEQELTRSEEARIAAAKAAAQAREAAEAARAEIKAAHEQRIAATEDCSTHRLARVRVEQTSAELQRRLDEREKALATEQARREEAERRATTNEQALQTTQSAADVAQRTAQSATEALAEATARHRAELEEARQAAQRQAAAEGTAEDHAAATAAFEEVLHELETLSQTHAAALAERDAAHERAIEEAARKADERIAARERALADQHVEEKKQSDARWMVEMQGRVLGAIEMLEADRGEALAALRAAHVSELTRKEAAWIAQRHELEREIRELAIDDAKKLDDVEEAAERANALKAELSEIIAERDRLVVELDRAQAALPAERARFAAAQSEWRAAREALKREVQAVQLAMQQALDRLLRSDRPPPDE